jgi:cell division protein FtsZ
MTINLHIPDKVESLRPTITVVGVGGAGGNAVNNMIASGLEGVNFVVANTDAQALDNALTDRTIQLGASITKGLGAGANPDIGRASAEEARDEIAELLEGSNMVFITAGMGGGTGTGAASVVARVAKEMGVLTVAVVTKPFQFEGAHRMRLAEAGLKELQDYVDTLIVIPNQNLFRIANERTTFADAFKMADDVLHSGVRGVTDLMVKPGLINLDFADIRTVMREMGKAMMGTGEATGDRRAIEAAEAAISNPLLDDVSLRGARALLINITGGADMTLFEADEAANRIREEVDPDANIIFGSTFSDAMEGKMRVSVVATGIDAQVGANHGPKQVTGADIKRPQAFTPMAAPKAEMPKSVVRPAEENVQQRSGGAVRLDRPAEPTLQQPSLAIEPQVRPAPAAEDGVRPLMREPASAAALPGLSAEMYAGSVAPAPQAQEEEPAVAEKPRHHAHKKAKSAPRGDGFFKRSFAGLSRAFAAQREHEMDEEYYDTVQERVHVTKHAQVEVTEKSPRVQPSDERDLDIPAFLRRQAN